MPAPLSRVSFLHRIVFGILLLAAVILSIFLHCVQPFLAGLLIGALGTWIWFQPRVGSEGPASQSPARNSAGPPIFPPPAEREAKDGDALESLMSGTAPKTLELERPEGEKSGEARRSFSELSGNLARLAAEQESLSSSFGELREAVREWTADLGRAGKINQAMIHLNAVLVTDNQKAAVDAGEAAKSATEGVRSVGREIRAMTDLKATLGSSTEVIHQLSQASDQIGDFLATITSISRKTNLLALNAGIEAARAGEQGRGFAVVAGEIKTLAESSAQASADVKNLVDDIRKKTASAISIIGTTGKIEENVGVVYNAGDIFMSIVKNIRKAGELLGEISKALKDQRDDNEMLFQLIQKLQSSGEIEGKFEAIQRSLEAARKFSRDMEKEMESLSP